MSAVPKLTTPAVETSHDLDYRMPSWDGSDMRGRLWRALWDAQLVTVPEVFGPCVYTTIQRGCREWETLSRVLETDSDHPPLEGLEGIIDTDSCISVLGSAHAMTEFLLAPLKLPKSELPALLSLGALASFIGSVYDDLLDSAPDMPLSLTPSALHRLASGKRPNADSEGPIDSPGSRLMIGLVGEYFRRLNTVVSPSANPRVIRCLQRCILRMYEAETQTLPEHRGAMTQRSLRRKAALPFVVMGLPGWLTSTPPPTEQYYAHMRWVYRVGAFIGLIDDVVDLPDDIRANHPNLVQEWLWEGRHDLETGNIIARRIALEGRRLLSEWESAIGCSDALPRDVVEALPTCVVSWLSAAKSGTKNERR